MSSFLIACPVIYLESGPVHDYMLWVDNGKIAAVLPADNDQLPSDLACKTYPTGSMLLPGMIDMHIHGAAGHDVMDATPEALDAIATALLQEGVTGFLATTMTATTAEIEAALVNIAQYPTQPGQVSSKARLLGIHLEGPYLSPERAGAQKADLMCDPNIEQFQHWQSLSGDQIRQVTLAPELNEAETFIRYLQQAQIIASIGHTNASCQYTQEAIEWGATQATHLFNAMSGLAHRTPGAAMALLMDARVYAELIVDEQHLAPETVQLAYQVKSDQRLILVSDAMRAKCMANGVYDLGGQRVVVDGQSARLENGVLAGSVLKLNEACRNMHRTTACSVESLIQMSAENPAKQLGIFHEVGSIAIGKRADLVVMDSTFQVLDTFMG